MHTTTHFLWPMPFAVALTLLSAVVLLAPAQAGAYNESVQKCISKYTYVAQPRLARNTLKAACVCSNDTTGSNDCSRWPKERIDCVTKHMPDATDNNAARQVNLFCNRKSGLRHN